MLTCNYYLLFIIKVTEKQETQPSDNAVSVGVKRKDISTSSVHKTKGEKTEEAQQAKSKTGNTLEEPQALVQVRRIVLLSKAVVFKLFHFTTPFWMASLKALPPD